VRDEWENEKRGRVGDVMNVTRWQAREGRKMSNRLPPVGSRREVKEGRWEERIYVLEIKKSVKVKVDAPPRLKLCAPWAPP
jgi:hypothetical protein